LVLMFWISLEPGKMDASKQEGTEGEV
jgi:hypothetical protein